MMTGFGKNKHSNPFKPKNRTFFGKKQKNYPPPAKLLDNVFFYIIISFMVVVTFL